MSAFHTYHSRFVLELMIGAKGDLMFTGLGDIKYRHYEGEHDNPILIKCHGAGSYPILTDFGKQFILENLPRQWTPLERKFLLTRS